MIEIPLLPKKELNRIADKYRMVPDGRVDPVRFGRAVEIAVRQAIYKHQQQGIQHADLRTP